MWVALGGALGATARWGGGLAFKGNADAFPLGTLVVNLVGCLLIGVLFGAGWLNTDNPRRLLLGVGFLGSLTTFSAFGLETIQLLQAGRWELTLANLSANVVGGLVLVAIGIISGKMLWAVEA